jgi:hypothetical protein
MKWKIWKEYGIWFVKFPYRSGVILFPEFSLVLKFCFNKSKGIY